MRRIRVRTLAGSTKHTVFWTHEGRPAGVDKSLLGPYQSIPLYKHQLNHLIRKALLSSKGAFLFAKNSGENPRGFDKTHCVLDARRVVRRIC